MIDGFIGEMVGQVVTGEQVLMYCLDWLMVKVGGPGELVAYIAKIQVQFFLSQGIDGGIDPLSLRLYK